MLRNKNQLSTDPLRPQSGFRELRGRENQMLGWVVTFFILAIFAAYLGFFAFTGVAATIFKLWLLAFIALLVIAGVSAAIRDKTPAL